jgi:hypothetical protein
MKVLHLIIVMYIPMNPFHPLGEGC